MNKMWRIVLFSGLLLVGLAGWWVVYPPESVLGEAPAYIPEATNQPVTPIPQAMDLDQRKVQLGQRLFHDKRLSRDGTIACSSCHDLNRAGQDGLPVARGIGGRLNTINSPTVFNSGFNFRQFWDGRVADLEAQVEGPVHNAVEMDSNWSLVLAKLAEDRRLRSEFGAIWQDGLTSRNLQSAIAEFERSLITPDSNFDRFLRGDAAVLSPHALRGWHLFHDLGCIACHQGVNLGGNMYANLGVMADYFAERGKPELKSDLGRYNVTGEEADRHVFKVPGLRNVVRTAPYFHDGSIATLEKAVDTMAHYQLGITLAPGDREALLAFFESLTGFYEGRPL